MKYARRTDDNHKDVRSALRAIGVGVHDTSHAGCGFPDLLCGWHGRILLVEVKDGRKKPSATRLTSAQEALRNMLRAHGCEIHVVRSIDEALQLFGADVKLTGPERFAEGT